VALLGIVAVGVVTGLIAHFILGRDGYSYFGEIMLGILGATILGFLSGIVVGMRGITIEVLVSALLGSATILSVVVILTLRTRSGHISPRGAGRTGRDLSG
jgi:uncharacterized membrane protein YeaQ/YmgE (transglycosylase-associated protein family)